MGNYRTFSLSQMSRVQTCLKTLPWREKVGKANVFVKPNEQSSNLFENSAMARKGRQSQPNEDYG